MYALGDALGVRSACLRGKEYMPYGRSVCLRGKECMPYG